MKILSIIAQHPGITKNEIGRRASDKSKKDWMNKNTAFDMLKILENNNKVIVSKSSKYSYYLPVDYYTKQVLDKILEKKILEMKNNFKKSIKKVKKEFDVVNDLGTNYIFKYLEEMNHYITNKLDLSPSYFDDLDSHYNNKQIKAFKKYCKDYPDEKSQKLLHDSENIYKKFSKCNKQIQDVKEKISNEFDKEKKLNFVMDLLDQKEIESQLFRELQRLHNKMWEFEKSRDYMIF